MSIALVAALLLAQPVHGAPPQHGEVQQQKPAPVPESEKPRAGEHGVTLGKQEAAPGAHEARHHPEGEGKPGEAKEEGGVAEDIFHHVTDEVWVPLAGLIPVPAIAGKFPGISTATGNLGVTVVLALFTFVVTQIAGMRAQGVLGYWAHLVPAGVPKWLFPIMVPVEVLGLFTKPFALTVRLFANMVAGHIVIFFLIALTVIIAPWVAPVSVAFALGIYLLEIFVALVQAYIFTMLSAVFIGMTQAAH